MDDNVSDDGDGTTSDDLDTSTKIENDGDGAKLLSPSMHRHLCHRCDSVVALVVMALLPSPLMRRRLALVDDDGDGMTGDGDYNDFDDATDFAIVAMVLLLSSQWRHCRCQCAGILLLSTMMVTAQWATKSMMMATARRATTLTMMAKARHTTASTTVAGATGDEVDNDGDGAMGNKVNDDGDGATKYDNDDDDDDDVRRCQQRHQLNDERRGQQSQRATIEIAMTTKTPAHRRQRCLYIGDGQRHSQL